MEIRQSRIVAPISFWPFTPATFRRASGFAERARDQAIRVSKSERSAGVDRVYAPGELVWATRKGSDGVCRLDAPTVRSLVDTAESVGLGNFEASLLGTKGA